MTYENLPKHLQQLGKGTQKAFNFLSQKNNLNSGEKYWKDHYLRTDMEKAIQLVKSGKILKTCCRI
jgi:hypothetical protein